MKNKFVVGIGGLARAGKDTCSHFLIKALARRGLAAERMALADALKVEIRPALIAKYGIDVLCCTPDQKEKIRPELVALGAERRLQSKGTFWTDILDREIEKSASRVIIVPDIRYNLYPHDEVQWVKKRRGGLLLHVKRFLEKDGAREYLTPPNEDERSNDPKVRSEADIKFEWPTLPWNTLDERYIGFFDFVADYIHERLKNS